MSLFRLPLLSFAALALTALSGTASALGNGFGITVTGTESVSARITDVNLRSTALVIPATVRVMLPDGYDDDPNRRYPVLYLLHGGGGTHEDWTHLGAESATAGLPVIVVQPDGDRGGWWADALTPGLDGLPRWETFAIRQMIPWIDANFRTLATREGRAIAGLSMGGYGTMSYAARHPDLFVSASSFSGAVDTSGAIVANWIGVSPLIEARLPSSIFGVFPFDTDRRQAHNPTRLAANLRGMHLAFYFGNGQPGPLDGNVPNDPVSQFMGWIQEDQVHAMNLAMHAKLDSLGIAHDMRGYGNGLHTAGYWARSLREELPAIMATFANPPAAGNALADAGFEGSGGNTGVAPWECLRSCGVDRYLGYARSGVGNGWVRNRRAGWNDIHQTVQVAANTRYTLTGWVRTSANSDNGFFGVRTNGGTVIGERQFTRLDGYTKLTVNVNTGNNTQLVVFGGVWTDHGDIWLQIDDVSLTPGG
ncbi:MAG: alpha/beta hydrolase [Pseudomonadota bacterium]